MLISCFSPQVFLLPGRHYRVYNEQTILKTESGCGRMKEECVRRGVEINKVYMRLYMLTLWKCIFYPGLHIRLERVFAIHCTLCLSAVFCMYPERRRNVAVWCNMMRGYVQLQDTLTVMQPSVLQNGGGRNMWLRFASATCSSLDTILLVVPAVIYRQWLLFSRIMGHTPYVGFTTIDHTGNG